jgi:alpha-1,2-mannosyltransferase
MTRRRLVASVLRVEYRQARGHAMIAAVIGWLSVAAFVGLGPSNRSLFGPLKWADFAHFYTLGHVARTRSTALLYDGSALHARQVALVADSSDEGFLPVYGPQTALLFAPLSLLPYFTAGLLWALATMAIYACVVWLAWRPARRVLPDRVFLIAAALAFPPIWQLILHGQTTAVVLVAFTAGWAALEADRRVLAGLALSLIAIKPQFGLVLAPVALLAGEWRLIAGVLVGVCVQALAVVIVFGVSALAAYASAISRLPALTDALEPNAYKMHSLRSLTHMLPGRADAIAWGILSVAVIAATGWVWRRPQAWRLRLGVLVMASALVNPHLTIYDVTVLALPIIWIGGWILERQVDTAWYWQRVYWITGALLFPTAAVMPIQLSTILVAELFVRIVSLDPPIQSAGLSAAHSEGIDAEARQFLADAMKGQR